MPPQDDAPMAPPAFPKLPPSARTCLSHRCRFAIGSIYAPTNKRSFLLCSHAHRCDGCHTVLAKLQSFLPVMEQENKKLEQAVAEGGGAKHCIEADEDSAEPEQQAADGEGKPQVIEMVRPELRRGAVE